MSTRLGILSRIFCRMPLGLMLFSCGYAHEGTMHRQWTTTIQIERIAYRLEIVRSLTDEYPLSLASLSTSAIVWPAIYLEPLDLRKDAWGHEFYYRKLGASSGATKSIFKKPSRKKQSGYILASCGRDGKCADPWYKFWTPRDPNADIAVQGGAWLHHPRRFALCDASVSINETDSSGEGHFEIKVSTVERPPFGVMQYISASNAGSSEVFLLESQDELILEGPGRYTLELPTGYWDDQLELTRRFALREHNGEPTQIIALALCNRVPEGHFVDNVDTFVLEVP